MRDQFANFDFLNRRSHVSDRITYTHGLNRECHDLYMKVTSYMSNVDNHLKAFVGRTTKNCEKKSFSHDRKKYVYCSYQDDVNNSLQKFFC